MLEAPKGKRLVLAALLWTWAGPTQQAGPARAASAGPAHIDNLIERLPPADRRAVDQALERSGANRDALIRVLEDLPGAQRAGAAFLIANMPQHDLQALSAEWLLEHIAYAYRAREAMAWGDSLPDELFLNYVLPYASVNERRDRWRRDFYERFMPVVRDCATPSEAALRLNRAVFEMTGVEYHPTKRPKPDQSPRETLQAGYASCTGLSILLIDACRAVGVPARFVGTPSWTSETGNTHPGNHSWIEVWDGAWHFLGASEVTALDHTWFFRNASRPEMEAPGHRIYATSFRRTATPFPLVWDASNHTVSAREVTRLYTVRRGVTFEVRERPAGPAAASRITVRLDGEIVARGAAGAPHVYPLAGGTTYEVTIEPADGRPQVLRSAAVGREPTPAVTLYLTPHKTP